MMTAGAGHLMVGLDVQAGWAGIIAVSQPSSGHYLLRAAVVAELSESVPAEGVIQDLRAEAGVRSEGVRCNLGPASVIVHETQFPEMPLEDLRSAARIEAGQLIPDLDRMAVDCQVIGRSATQEGAPQVKVMVVAAPRQAIEERAALLGRARVRVLSLVPDGVALANAVSVLRPPQEAADVLLDIGADNTVLVAVMPPAKAMAPVVRQVAGGLDLLGAPGKSRPTDARTADMAKDQWLQDVERSVQFVSSKLDAPAQRLLVVGDGAGSPTLLDWIKQNLAIPVYSWNPLNFLGRGAGAPPDSFVKEQGPRLAVAVGLALMEGT